MVRVASSRGGFVDVQVKGVAETIRHLRARNKDIEDGADLGTFQGANLIQQEWQESIMGRRAEPKSVDTAKYANSPDVNKISKAQYKVLSDVPYAQFLEFGTVHIQPRGHLTNTVERNRSKVKAIIDVAIRLKLKI